MSALYCKRKYCLHSNIYHQCAISRIVLHMLISEIHCLSNLCFCASLHINFNHCDYWHWLYYNKAFSYKWSVQPQLKWMSSLSAQHVGEEIVYSSHIMPFLSYYLVGKITSQFHPKAVILPRRTWYGNRREPCELLWGVSEGERPSAEACDI